MFKSRKGFELKNSLTEYIPDTYFEYGEWDKFLFERDNLRLIKAAEQMPKGSVLKQLEWATQKSQIENQQRKKNKTKYKGLEI